MRGMVLTVSRTQVVEQFLANAGDFLGTREAEHNLIFGISSQLVADPAAFDGSPYLATVIDGERVVGAALQTPPWRVVLSMFDDEAAADLLAADLVGSGIPGVVGP